MFKKFLYFLLDEQGRSYFMQNKTLQQSAMPKALPETPEGWQDIQIGWERDMKKLGVARSFTLPMHLRLTVMKMLRTLVFSRSIEEKVYLLIQKLHCQTDGGTFQFLYKYLYKGEFDLASFKYDDQKDSCPLVEGGARKLVTANESTTYEIDIDNDPEVQVVRMDGLNLQESGRFLPVDGIDIKKSVFGSDFYLPISFLNSEGLASGIAYSTQNIGSTGAMTFAQVLSSANHLVIASIYNRGSVDIHLKGSITFQCLRNDPSLGFRTRFLKSSQTTANQNDYQVFSVIPVAGRTYHFDIDRTITLQPGERLYWQGIYYGGITGAVETNIQFMEGSTLSVDYKNRYRDTYVLALKPSTVLKRLAEKMGLQPSDVDTTFFEKWDHLLLASGDSNRGLPGAKHKTSLNDFTQFVRVVMAGGQGIENGVLRYAEYDEFLNDSNPLHLGEAKELKTYPAKDLLGNVLKIGYPEKEIDNVNGKYAFNNLQIRTMPMTRVVQELSFICPYIADPYYIEINRINLEGKTTTDNASDNEVLILSTVNITYYVSAQISGSTLVLSGSMDTDLLSRSRQLTVTNSPLNNGTYTIKSVTIAGGVATVTVAETLRDEAGMISVTPSAHLLKRYPYSQVSGVPDPGSIFNIEDLSPMRLIKKQGRYLNSLCDGLQGRAIAYQSTGKNNELKTTFNGQTIEEKADYLVSAPKLFKPWYFEFETTVPQDLVETLEATPNRAFSFTWYGVTYTGFLVRAALSPNDNKPQTFKLLAAPSTDLTTLINPYG